MRPIFLQNWLPRWNRILTSVKVHPQLSNNGHSVDGVLVGAGSRWPWETTGAFTLSLRGQKCGWTCISTQLTKFTLLCQQQNILGLFHFELLRVPLVFWINFVWGISTIKLYLVMQKSTVRNTITKWINNRTLESISSSVQYVILYTVLSMWIQTVNFIAKKSKCAGLAQEIGFSAPDSCTLPCGW